MRGGRQLALRLHGGAMWAGGWHASTGATPPPRALLLHGGATEPARPSRPTRCTAAPHMQCSRVLQWARPLSLRLSCVPSSSPHGVQANRRAVIIQAHVRGYLTRSSFRKATELGKRQAARAALQAKRNNAAVVIQKHARRLSATKRVCNPGSCSHTCILRKLLWRSLGL